MGFRFGSFASSPPFYPTEVEDYLEYMKIDKNILGKPVRPKIIVKPKLNTKKEKQKAKLVESVLNYRFGMDFGYEDPVQMYETTFNHVYFARGFNLSGNDKYPSRHGCLRSGYFCLKNLREYPLDLITYLKIKIKLNLFKG